VLVETSIHYSKLLRVTPPQCPLMGPSDPRHSDDLIITPPSFNIVVEILGPFHYLGFKVLKDARILHECNISSLLPGSDRLSSRTRRAKSISVADQTPRGPCDSPMDSCSGSVLVERA